MDRKKRAITEYRRMTLLSFSGRGSFAATAWQTRGAVKTWSLNRAGHGILPLLDRIDLGQRVNTL
jgi:hypothetical protein